MDYKEHC
jgi:dynein heavy chain, axonemal